MALAKEAKTELVKSYRKHETDTGSPEVQVAILANRITYLTEHFKQHKKDPRLRKTKGKSAMAKVRMNPRLLVCTVPSGCAGVSASLWASVGDNEGDHR